LPREPAAWARPSSRPDFSHIGGGISARMDFPIAWAFFFLYNSYKIKSDEIEKELMGQYNELNY
jgi:hypothetical protein